MGDSRKLKSAVNFIFKARQKFGQKFNYSKVDYCGLTQAVIIICPVHGHFTQSPDQHLRGTTGCVECGKLAAKIYSKSISRTDYVNGTRLCKKCDKWEALDEFRCSVKKDGTKFTSPYCRPCEREIGRNQAKDYRLRNPDKVKEAVIKSYRKRMANMTPQEKKEFKKQREQRLLLSSKKTNIKYIKCECGVIEVVRVSIKRAKRCRRCESKHNSRQWSINRHNANKHCKCCSKIMIVEYGNQKQVCDNCIEKNQKAARKKAKRIRRMRKRGVVTGSYKSIDIIKRDKWKCKLCGIRVQKKDLLADDAAEIDHIIPLSLGGPDVYDNVQCTCRKCNRHKSNSIAGQLGLFASNLVQRKTN